MYLLSYYYPSLYSAFGLWGRTLIIVIFKQGIHSVTEYSGALYTIEVI